VTYKDDQTKGEKNKREGCITTLSLPLNLPSAESFGSSLRPTWHLQTGVLDNRKIENQPAPCKKQAPERSSKQVNKWQITRFWNNNNNCFLKDNNDKI
jgi:hypothetical protein